MSPQLREKIEAAKARNEAAEQVRDALAARFALLLPGEQAVYHPLYVAIKKQIDERNFAAVRILLQTAPAITPGLEAARAELLAILPEK